MGQCVCFLIGLRCKTILQRHFKLRKITEILWNPQIVDALELEAISGSSIWQARKAHLLYSNDDQLVLGRSTPKNWMVDTKLTLKLPLSWRVGNSEPKNALKPYHVEKRWCLRLCFWFLLFLDGQESLSQTAGNFLKKSPQWKACNLGVHHYLTTTFAHVYPCLNQDLGKKSEEPGIKIQPFGFNFVETPSPWTSINTIG